MDNTIIYKPSDITEKEQPLPVPQVGYSNPSDVNIESLLKTYQQYAYKEDPNLSSEMETYLKLLENKPSVDYEKIAKQYGLDEKTKKLQEVQAKLAQIKAEEDTLDDRLTQMAKGQGMTKIGIKPIRNDQLRDIQIRKRYALAEFSALNDDYTNALKNVETAIELEKQKRQDEIDALKARINWVKEQLNNERLKNKDLAQIWLKFKEKELNQKQKELEEAKRERKDIQLLALNALLNGAPAFIVEKIRQSKSLEEAMQSGGKWVAKPADYRKATQPISTTKSARPLSPNEIAKLAEMGYVVYPGDTIYTIQQRYPNISPQDLASQPQEEEQPQEEPSIFSKAWNYIKSLIPFGTNEEGQTTNKKEVNMSELDKALLNI